jgi:hypothetical protein
VLSLIDVHTVSGVAKPAYNRHAVLGMNLLCLSWDVHLVSAYTACAGVQLLAGVYRGDSRAMPLASIFVCTALISMQRSAYLAYGQSSTVYSAYIHNPCAQLVWTASLLQRTTAVYRRVSKLVCCCLQGAVQVSCLAPYCFLAVHSKVYCVYII